jgi:dipeptide transport system permease protein
VIARQTRSAMLEVLGEDYVRTARAKGLRPSGLSACMRCATPDPGDHHHRPAGRGAAGRRDPDRDDLLLAGHRQVDGRQHLSRRDYPVVQGGLLLIAAIVMVVNLTVDVLYGLVNPRIHN